MSAWGGRKAQEYTRLVLATYGTQCWLCGGAGATTADHVVPLQHGGDPFDIANGRPAHFGCNSGRGNKTRHASRRTVVPTSRANGTSRKW